MVAVLLTVYSGLMPRLIGELLTIWLVNLLTHIINTHLASDDRQCTQVSQLDRHR